MSNITFSEFYTETLKAVRSLPISKVAQTRMKTKRSGQNVLARCPYHHDERVGSFILGGRTKGFKCFACGETGTTIDLVMHLDEIGYIEALFRIALEFEIVDQKQVDDYLSSKGEIKFDYDYTKNFHDFKEDWKRPEVGKENKDIINNVYEIFSLGNKLIKEEKLSAKHKKMLKEERQLSDNDIEEFGFFTFPSRKILYVFYLFLKAHHNYTPEVLAMVPGFYGFNNEFVEDEKGYLKIGEGNKIPKMTFGEMDGIGIPIKDENGKITAIQVRLDEKKDNGLRYVWFSSSWAEDKEDIIGGMSTSSPKDVIYPKKIKNTTVFVTEGKFKAIQISKKYGSIAISIQGVSSWRGLEELLVNIQGVVKEKVKLNHLMVAYDGDMFLNAAVMQQTVKLADAIHESTALDVHIAVWDTENGSGIDDLILNKMSNTLRSYSYEKFKEVYDKFKDELNEQFNPKKKSNITREMTIALKNKMLKEFK